MDRIATLPARDRRELFSIVAAGSRESLDVDLSAAVVEKDFWVCWLMGKLFHLPEGAAVEGSPHLLFKGGTSLSKAFGVIKRFSEDIDVSVESTTLGIDLAPLSDPGLSNTRRKKLAAALSGACVRYVRDQIQPALASAVSMVLGNESWILDRTLADAGPTLLMSYPRAVDSDESLLPEVRLEFGARSDLHPWSQCDIRPYVWAVRPDALDDDGERATIRVPTLAAERTFWEKVTLLHVENNRSLARTEDEPRAWRRISRHGYDLVMLADVGVAARAIEDADLFRRVCETKHRWYRSGHSDYDTLTRAQVSIVPMRAFREAFVRDYAAMGAIFFAPLHHHQSRNCSRS